MNDILILAFEYMKIGAVAIGGGYTVIPFSNLTPGPIGINMATFVGVKVGGILGAAFVTFAFMVPSFIIVCSLSKFLKKNKENKLINNIMYGLRPAAVALISVAGLKIMNTTVFNLNGFLCNGIKTQKEPHDFDCGSYCARTCYKALKML